MRYDQNKFPGLVFIVEDNDIYAKTLEMFLKTRFPATQVLVFSEGEPALGALYKKPDFVILDYYLNAHRPDAPTGLAVAKEMKARDPDVKLFVLSAQQDISVALAVKEAGCLYLVKNGDAFKNLEELIVRDLN